MFLYVAGSALNWTMFSEMGLRWKTKTAKRTLKSSSTASVKPIRILVDDESLSCGFVADVPMECNTKFKNSNANDLRVCRIHDSM